MSDLRTAILEYIEVADQLRLQGLRDGSMSIAEAKQDAAEMEKWRAAIDSIDELEALRRGP